MFKNDWIYFWCFCWKVWVDAVFAVSRSTVGLSWCTVFEKTLRGLANWTWRLWLGFQHQCLVLIFPRMWWPDTFSLVLGETKSSDALLVGSGGHKVPIIFHFFQRHHWHHCPFHRLMPAFEHHSNMFHAKLLEQLRNQKRIQAYRRWPNGQRHGMERASCVPHRVGGPGDSCFYCERWRLGFVVTRWDFIWNCESMYVYIYI